MQSFWENFPKTLRSADNALELALFPRECSSLHELQGGEQKTHEFHVAFARDPVTELPLDWGRCPLLASVSPEWFAKCKAIPNLLPRDEDPNLAYCKLVDSAIQGAQSFESKREFIDEYGWRNFGDIYADHEALYCRSEEPLVSHYNNQYDAVRGFAIQFMRSGDSRWYKQMRELARHVIDIDVYHTTEDKSAYNRGLFWHTDHYVDAGPSNHRSYPPSPGVSGGGPAPGHLYATGLLLHYFLTGDEQSYETVTGFGRYVVDCDDGHQSRYRLLDSGYTGHASESGLDRSHGPGRTPANAISVLVDAARVSKASVYLEKAEQLIRRCIHPHDDIDALNLLDTENHWYYTLFIKSLDHFLTRKLELGEFDFAYAYARSSILHYARWAKEHEYPYLDKPERLEFPNETWAAQDMHKSEMFKVAAKLTSGKERDAFVERASYFFDYSVNTLSAMQTSGLARTTVLMMSFGYAQGYYAALGVPEATTVELDHHDFGRPVVFVPQKQRAMWRLLILATSGAVLGLAGLGWLIKTLIIQ